MMHKSNTQRAEEQVIVGCMNSSGEQSISREVETRLREYVVGVWEYGIWNEESGFEKEEGRGMRVDVGLNIEEILLGWRGSSYRDGLFVVSSSAGTGHLSCHTCLEPARQGFSEGCEPRSVRVILSVGPLLSG